MMLKSHMAPAHPHPMPSIRAKPQLGYTAMHVATFVEQPPMLEQNIMVMCNWRHPIRIHTYQLGRNEGTDQQESRAFNKGPALRPGNKDECLTHNTHLKIESSGHLISIMPDWSNTKFVLQIEKLLESGLDLSLPVYCLSLTEKKSVSWISQKKRTVIRAR